MWPTLGSVPLARLCRREFAGYGPSTLRRDLLAGLTVGAVALPLALAFGVASGADAAAGLVTAILAGFLIAGLGGASFQISGPTGAMSAVLIVLAQRHGLAGIWAAGVLAGVMLMLLGLFRLGRYVAFIPAPVITGFTSGIALIIAIGQLDNLVGLPAPASHGALDTLWRYATHPPTPDPRALALAGLTVATMLLLPRLARAVPGSLAAIALVTAVAALAGWEVPLIGEIPRTLVLDQRLTLATIPWADLGDLMLPAVSIAALGAIESLLCGAVGSTMTGELIDSNQELIGQGIGNIVIPFFGGVPATAAIARTSVAIKSGAATRLTSIVHAGVLLLSALVLAPLIGRVPLAALAGVLLVTAWRMNEWESLHFFARRGLRHALAGVLVTMVATVALDLTQAIIIGVAVSAVVYLRQSAMSMAVARGEVDPERLRAQGHDLRAACPAVHVYYLTGPLFFGSVHAMLEAFETAGDYRTLVISMRGVPLVDAMGARALTQVVEEQRSRCGTVVLCGLQPAVRATLAGTGLLDQVGEEGLFWSADRAIMAVHRRHQDDGCPDCAARRATPDGSL